MGRLIRRPNPAMASFIEIMRLLDRLPPRPQINLSGSILGGIEGRFWRWRASRRFYWHQGGENLA